MLTRRTTTWGLGRLLPALVILLAVAGIAAVPARSMPAGAVPAGTFVWASPFTIAAAAGSNQAMHLSPGPDGSVYVLSELGSVYPDLDSFSVTRLAAPGGKVIWQHVYKAPSGFAMGTALATDPHGNVVIAGAEKATTSAGRAWMVLKYRGRDGKLLWKREMSSPASGGVVNDATPSDVAVGTDGSICAAGFFGGTYDGTRPTDGLAVKYTPAGRVIWRYRVATSRDEALNGVTLDGSGNAYVAGWQVAAAPLTGSRGIIRRIGPSGHARWARTVGDGSKIVNLEPPVVHGKSVYLGSTGAPGLAYGVTVTRYARASGRIQWRRSTSEFPDAYQNFVAFGVDGGGRAFVVSDAYGVAAPGHVEILSVIGWVAVLRAPDGRVAWRKAYFNDTGSAAYAGWLEDAATDAAGNVYCAGGVYSASGDPGPGHASVVRLSAAGGRPTKTWIPTGDAIPGNQGVDDAMSILCTRRGVFAGGQTLDSGSSAAFVQRLRP